MGFQGTRGKQTYLFDYPEEYEKRALAMGFQGTRGKKEAFPMEWEKRAPMGFQGMRGKKALYDEMIEELEKRALMDLQVKRLNSTLLLLLYRSYKIIKRNVHIYMLCLFVFFSRIEDRHSGIYK